MHGPRLVRTERREHRRRQRGPLQRAVRREVVGRVVRGAEGGDAEFFQDAVRREPGRAQALVGMFPDAGGGGLVEGFVDAEVALQFQVGPVVERIAQREGHGGRPSTEFLLGIGVARDEAFVDAVGPHGAPFVVVALQPDFVQVAELPVARDVAGREVAMVVEDRLRRGEGMVETARGGGVKQEIVVDEVHAGGGWRKKRCSWSQRIHSRVKEQGRREGNGLY